MDWNWAISIFYKLAAVSAGTFIVYLGYKLFIKSVYGDTGEVSLDWNNNRVLLKRIAPGSTFAIFGALIIAITVITPATYSPSGGISAISWLDVSQTSSVEKLKKLIETGNLDDDSKAVLKEVVETMNGKGGIWVHNAKENLNGLPTLKGEG